MAAIAATTQHIRVGSAGVMLPHYATLEGGGAVPRAGRHRARADRSGAGAGARLGRADGARAQSQRGDGRRPFSRTGARPAGMGERAAAGGGASVPQRARAAGRRDGSRRCGYWAARTTARRSRRISACRIASRTSSPTAMAPRRRSTLYRETFRPERVPGRAACRACASGRWRRTPSRRRRGCSRPARCSGWGATAASTRRCRRRMRRPRTITRRATWPGSSGCGRALSTARRKWWAASCAPWLTAWAWRKWRS